MDELNEEKSPVTPEAESAISESAAENTASEGAEAAGTPVEAAAEVTPAEISSPEVPAEMPMPEIPTKKSFDFAPIKAFFIKKWPIFAGALALVLVMALSFDSIVAAISPKAAIKMAFDRTEKALTSKLEKSPYFTVLKSAAELENGGEIAVDAEYESDYSHITGGVSAGFDKSAKALAVSAECSTGDDFEISADAVLTDDYAAAKLDDSDYYGITFETFGDDLKKSSLADELEPDTIDSVIEAVDSFAEAWNEGLNGKKDTEDVFKPYTDIIDDFVDELDFEKDSRHISVSGDKIKCDNYVAEIDRSDMVSLVKDLADTAADDEDIMGVAAAVLAVEMEITPDEAEDALNEILRNIKSGVSSYIPKGTETTLCYSIYKSRVVKFDAVVDMGDEVIEFTVEFGADPSEDDTVITFEYEDYISFRAVYAQDGDGEELTVEYDNYGYIYNAELETKWDKQSGAIATELYLDDDGYEDIYNVDWFLTTKSGETAFGVEDFELYGDTFTVNAAIRSKFSADLPDDYVNIDEWDFDAIGEFIAESLGFGGYGYDDGYYEY